MRPPLIFLAALALVVAFMAVQLLLAGSWGGSVLNDISAGS